MPALNLAWKGFPHHLPKIRVAPPPVPDVLSLNGSNLAHRAAEEVMNTPLSESLQKLRRAQRALVRRRRRSRVRVSFAHSTSSRGSKTKSSRRRLRIPKLNTAQTFPIQFAVPDAQKAYSILGCKPIECSLDDVCCYGSSSKRSILAKAVAEAQNVVSQPVDNLAYWVTHPDSPIKLFPEPESLQPTRSATSSHVPVNSFNETTHLDERIQSRQHSVKRRPRPTVGTTARYTLFPKSSIRKQKLPKMAIMRPPVDLGRLEAIRKSLSSQDNTSWRAPSQDSPTIPKADRLPQRRPISPSSLTELPAPSQNSQAFRTTSSSPQKSLDSFVRDLEEWVIATGSAINSAAVKPSTRESHPSVRTVEELLPYRQQFEAAGLAISSADQRGKAPKAGAWGFPSLGFDAGSRCPQELSSGHTKESSSGTIVHLRTAKPLASSDQVSPSSMAASPLAHTARVTEKAIGGNMQSPGLDADLGTLPSSRRELRRRPSGLFLRRNKTLPVEPASFQDEHLATPHAAAEGVDSSIGPEEAKAKPKRRKLLKEPTGEVIPETREYQVMASSMYPRNSSKVLSTVPASRKPSQRQGIIIPSKTSYQPTAQKHPTTIEEETEPSPKKPKSFRDRARKTYKPEIPETWKHAIGTPMSFQKALDDVVRKLEDMEDTQTGEPLKHVRPPKRTHSVKPPSPSQRLQRAVALRRQRLADEALQNPEMNDEPPQSKSKRPNVPPITIPARNPRRLTEDSAQKGSSMTEDGQAHITDENDVSDRDVLKGLRIICAASADTKLDALIQAKTGLCLRRFLADLTTYEGLSPDGIAEVDETRVKRQRSQRRNPLSETQQAVIA